MQKDNVYANTFLWLFIGLLISFSGGYALSINESLANQVLVAGIIPIFITELVIAFAFGFFINKMSAPVAKICYIIFSIVTGITFSSLFIVFELKSLLMIFLTTAIIFGVLALYGHKTKTDLSKFSTILLVSLIISIIVSLINVIIFHSSIISIIINAVGVLIFCGFIAYDTKKIPVLANYLGNEKAAVYCAFELYLDFINVFINLLDLFGKRKD